jgi:hypothetical protein
LQPCGRPSGSSCTCSRIRMWQQTPCSGCCSTPWQIQRHHMAGPAAAAAPAARQGHCSKHHVITADKHAAQNCRAPGHATGDSPSRSACMQAARFKFTLTGAPPRRGSVSCSRASSCSPAAAKAWASSRSSLPPHCRHCCAAGTPVRTCRQVYYVLGLFERNISSRGCSSCRLCSAAACC